MPDTDNLLDPQVAIALMAPGLAAGGQFDPDAYRQQRLYQGLLGLGAGMLTASGPSLKPVGFGQALGTGLQGYLGAQQDYDKSSLYGAQAGRLLADTGKLTAERGLLQRQAEAAKGLGDLYGQLNDYGGASGRGVTRAAATAGLPGRDELLTPGKASDLLLDSSPIADYKNYADRVAGVESGGNPNAKNPNSSATGLGQFTTGTWLDVAKRYFPKTAEMADSDLLALRTDPQFSKAMINAYAQDNSGVLSGAGIPVNNATLYAAHFLGPKGAVDVLSSAPDTPLSNVLPAAAINANPTLKSQTAGQFASNMAMKMGVSGNVGSTMRPQATGGPEDTLISDQGKPAMPTRMAQSAPVAPEALPPQLSLPNGNMIPRPDIAQQIVARSTMAGIKVPSFIEEAAKIPMQQYMEAYKAQLDVQKAYAGPGANPQLQEQLSAAKARGDYAGPGANPQLQGQITAAKEAATPTSPIKEFEYSQRNPGFPEYQRQQSQAGRPLNVGTIPPDYQVVTGPDGSFQMKLIPGSPTDLAQQERARGQQVSSGIVTQDINRALPMVGAWTTGPIGALTQNVPGTPAHNLGALIEGIGANVMIDKLQQMRMSSPTGGALGNVTEREGDRLMSTYGSLKQSQSQDQLRQNLERLRDQYNDIVYGSPQALDALLRSGRISQQAHDDALAKRAEASQAPSSGASGVTSSGIRWSIK